MDSLDEEQRKELQRTFSMDFFEHEFSKGFLTNKDFLVKFVEYPTYEHVLAAPLIEVFSVRVSNRTVDDGKPYEVYGTIEIIDGLGASFILYDQKAEMPETVCNGDTLTIVMGEDRAISITPSNKVTLKIDLKARFGDMDEQIVKDCHTWDYNTFDAFDKRITYSTNGTPFSAALDYVTYRHAVFTSMEVKLVKGRDDETCKSAHIYGNIVADCGNNYSTLLFDKKQNESIEVQYGTCIELSRDIVAVPAWAPFTIRANLWNAKTNLKVVDESDELSYEIPVSHDHRYQAMVTGQNGLIDITGWWCHAEQEPPLQENVEKSSNLENMSPMAQKLKVTPDQQTLPALSDRNLVSDFRRSLKWTLEAMEVFSISVFSNSDEELNIWGSIEAYRANYRKIFCTLFKRTSPERLLCNQTLPIEFPTRCISSPAFKVNLALLDIDGRVISKGNICWDYQIFDHSSIYCYNRLLCSIVRGDEGCYVAVHYSIFSAAIQATVKICLIDTTSSLKNTKISGCVRAQYKEFEYPTPYDMEVYRRKLFVGHIEDSSREYKDSKIQLLEKVVAVDESFTLIIDLNLTLISQHMDSPDKVKIDDAVETFEQQVIFRPDVGYKEMTLERTSHQIVVSVQWSEVM